jgi:tetratricopeptide (TPR) repeat protein
MFFAPILQFVTKRDLILKRSTFEHVISSMAGRNCLKGFLLTFLMVGMSGLHAQEASPQFADLAARAAAARDQQNIPLAIELYTQAEQLKPDWREGWFYLGLLQYGANQFPAAIDAFNHLLQLEPSAVPAMALRGLCEFETGAYDDSLRDLEQSIAHGAANEPRNEQILRYHLAQLLVRAGRFQDALTQYKIFIEKQVDSPDVLLGLGLAGTRVRLLPKEIPETDRGLYLAAGSAGYAFLSGNSELAASIFTELFARYPTAPNLHLFYGYLLFQHDSELAINQFQSELTIAPGNIEAHAILAYTEMIAGRYAEAVPEAEHVLAAMPDMEMALIALGRSLGETGDPKHGMELLNRVLQSDPDNLEAHMGLAAIYSRAGRREDAYRERMVCLGLAK